MAKKLKLDITPALKRLQILIKTSVSSKMVGNYKSVFRGTGLEFEGYREYTPDDDASLIDTKASARTNELLVKEYKEERQLKVFFLIDASSSMMLGTTEMLKMEYAAQLVASLGFAIIQANDGLGFVMFSNRIVKKVPIVVGKKQFYILSRTLVDLDNYGGGYDLINALKFGLSYIPSTAMVFIISDFIGLKGDWKRYIKILSKRYDLIGIMVRDPIDKSLPNYNHQVVLEHPFTGEQAVINPSQINEEYKRYTAKQEREVMSAFLDSDSDFIEVVTNKPFLEPIVDLFVKRSRRYR